jgi:hypothetical protein
LWLAERGARRPILHIKAQGMDKDQRVSELVGATFSARHDGKPRRPIEMTAIQRQKGGEPKHIGLYKSVST